MKLFLTIDLESWAYPNHPDFTGLASQERKALDRGYVQRSVYAILDILARHNSRITFFCVAEMFEWYPDAFRSIRQAGHEIAYHTHTHIVPTKADDMRRQLELSREFLAEFAPKGFRAPEINLSREAGAVLAQSGFSYSSSIYGGSPYSTDFLGNPFKEIPVSTHSYSGAAGRHEYPRPLRAGMLRSELPYGSGLFVALLPLKVLDALIRKGHGRGLPQVLFIHNWQIVPPEGATFPDAGYKLTHPLYWPYLLTITAKFEGLCRSFEIVPLEEYTWDQSNTGIERS